jgi:DNA mismatch endonuclease, patch repair protein
MSDVHSKEVRSYNMSRIKAKNTSPELIVRKFLFSKGFRYRLHDKKLPGKPDIVLPKYKTVIQVHGCFWHSHIGCKYFVVPKTKKEWWIEKLNKNTERDIQNIQHLNKLGWKVITIWECELKKQRQETTLNSLLELL